MPWPQTGATQYRAQLGLPDKGHAIKGFVVCYARDLESLDLLKGLALGCCRPSPEVIFVNTLPFILKTSYTLTNDNKSEFLFTSSEHTL